MVFSRSLEITARRSVRCECSSRSGDNCFIPATFQLPSLVVGQCCEIGAITPPHLSQTVEEEVVDLDGINSIGLLFLCFTPGLLRGMQPAALEGGDAGPLARPAAKLFLCCHGITRE